MKRIFLFATVLSGLILAHSSAYGSVRNVQDNHTVTYNVIDSNGDHVTGQTVVLKIQKVSNGYWFDFNDSSFKASGWTSKSTNLSEDSTEGFYYYLFNPPASETAADQYRFCVDNASGTYGDHQCETVDYQNISGFDSSSDTVTVGTNNDKTGYSLSAAGIDGIWDEVQSGHTSAGTFGKYLDALVSSASAPTAADVADAVWDEDISGHTTTGTTGKKLSDAGSAGDPFDTDISTGYTGKAGEYLRTLYRMRR